MTRFAARATTPELMDTEQVDYADFRTCLRHLAILNRLTLGYRPTLNWLDGMARKTGREKLSIVDYGFGYGDMLRVIQRWAAGRGLQVSLTGVDLNPWSARAAADAAPADSGIQYVTADLFAYNPPERPDIIISSLFAHHLPDESLIRFLKLMEDRARIGWFVNDLRRSAVSHALFGAATAVGPWHRFIRPDGMLSIRSAFVEADWERLIAAACIVRSRVAVARRWPWRLCVGTAA